MGSVVEGEVNRWFAIDFVWAVPGQVTGDRFENWRGFREIQWIEFGLRKLAESEKPSERSRALTLWPSN